jgi:hypothetical protein
VKNNTYTSRCPKRSIVLHSSSPTGRTQAQKHRPTVWLVFAVPYAGAQVELDTAVLCGLISSEGMNGTRNSGFCTRRVRQPFCRRLFGFELERFVNCNEHIAQGNACMPKGERGTGRGACCCRGVWASGERRARAKCGDAR